MGSVVLFEDRVEIFEASSTPSAQFGLRPVVSVKVAGQADEVGDDRGPWSPPWFEVLTTNGEFRLLALPKDNLIDVLLSWARLNSLERTGTAISYDDPNLARQRLNPREGLMAATNYDTVNGQLIGESTGGVTTTHLADELGSVVQTAQSGAVVNQYRYSPYGLLTSRIGTGPDPRFTWIGGPGYRATSRRFAEEYVRARHYADSIARWIARDRIWLIEPAYGYAGGKPHVEVDPLGLAPCGGVTTAIILVQFHNCDDFPAPPGAAACKICGGAWCSCSIDITWALAGTVTVSGAPDSPCTVQVSAMNCLAPFSDKQPCRKPRGCAHVKCDENQSCTKKAGQLTFNFSSTAGQTPNWPISGILNSYIGVTGTVELCDV